MWTTEDDEKVMQAAMRGHCNGPARESKGFIKDEYCPRCGAQKVKLDFVDSYIGNGYNNKVGNPLNRHLHCIHCGAGYTDTLHSRWDLRTRYSGNADLAALPPVPELCNPHNGRKNRALIAELKRKANGKKCRVDVSTPTHYQGKCKLPFGHEGEHRQPMTEIGGDDG